MRAPSLIGVTAEELSARADPRAAGQMAAYMKTEMPFYGVKKPARQEVLRRLVEEFPPEDDSSYRRNVAALWDLPHREERYLAISYARRFRRYVRYPQLQLYRRMITEGAWWDFVDEIAAHLIGQLLHEDRTGVSPVMEEWIDDSDLWLRRAALLSQLRHGPDTDGPMLFDFCRRRAHEQAFFIRKAIGWALRTYARTEPDAVRWFVAAEAERLSPLSRREATRHL